MNVVQKTITLEVLVTIEIDEDLIGTDGIDDPYDLAASVCYGMQQRDEAGELFIGATVKEYSAYVISVSENRNG